MKNSGDAFGAMLMDQYRGKEPIQLIERDDGLISVGDPAIYFAPYDDWSDDVKTAIHFVHGKVLDIGCGAGRHSLYLQGQNIDVKGIDVSPLALEVCGRRGLSHRSQASITELSSKYGHFDTLLLLGNNFGLVSNPRRARWLLRRFSAMTSLDAVIIAESRSPYHTSDPVHLSYHEHNRRRGRAPGQLRIRTRYLDIKDAWFDYLLVSLSEMEDILHPSGWQIKEVFDSSAPQYVVILVKEK